MEAHNYKERMHALLFIEELAQSKILSRLGFPSESDLFSSVIILLPSVTLFFSQTLPNNDVVLGSLYLVSLSCCFIEKRHFPFKM